LLYRGGIEAVVAELTPPSQPSAWWWLLPPVMFALQHRRTVDYRKQALGRMTDQQRAQYNGFMRKATGWFVVATGATLLAVKETWELAEHLEWPLWVFLVVVAAMVLLSLTVTSLAVARKAT
jgi:hypothetical protein